MGHQRRYNIHCSQRYGCARWQECSETVGGDLPGPDGHPRPRAWHRCSDHGDWMSVPIGEDEYDAGWLGNA